MCGLVSERKQIVTVEADSLQPIIDLIDGSGSDAEYDAVEKLRQ